MGASLNLSPIPSSLITPVCSTFALLLEFVFPPEDTPENLAYINQRWGD
jgi:hypothetical protein